MGAPYEFVDAFNDRMRYIFEQGKAVRLEGVEPGMPASQAASALLELKGLMSQTNAFIDAWPPVLRDAVIALVVSAASDGTRVRMAWMPAYDFEVTMAKANNGPVGEVTLLLRSKYPDELQLASAP
jgi:hypothetical protein